MLLTPMAIVITTPLSGSEINLASPTLRETWRYGVENPGAANATNLQSCVLGEFSRELFMNEPEGFHTHWIVRR